MRSPSRRTRIIPLLCASANARTKAFCIFAWRFLLVLLGLCVGFVETVTHQPLADGAYWQDTGLWLKDLPVVGEALLLMPRETR